MMQVALMPLKLVSMKASCDTHSEKLLFFKKAPTVDLPRNNLRNKGGNISMRQIEYPTEHPSPLLPQSSVQKGWRIFSGT